MQLKPQADKSLRQKYPTVYVVVPRNLLAFYWHQPWADVYAAGVEGRDGLRIENDPPRIWGGIDAHGKPPEPDVAFLAQGQLGWEHKTCLFQQNWTELL